MKKLLLVFFLIGPTLFPQEKSQEKILFSQAISDHLSDYNKKADLAYRFNDYDKGKELFEDFTQKHLEGSYIDNFTFHNLKRKEVALYNFEKPVFLITYASWCIPSKGEIPALNQLAKQYKGQIEFVVLFWDPWEKAKELSTQFNSEISVVYVDETENNGAYVVKQLKHSLGLPTCFLISEDKMIMDIRRSVFPPLNTQPETAYMENLIALESSISKSLLNKYENGYADNVSVVED